MCAFSRSTGRLQASADRWARLDRSTSGSTGERTVVKRTWFEERLLNGFRWRALRACGHGIRDRLAGIEFRAVDAIACDQRSGKARPFVPLES